MNCPFCNHIMKEEKNGRIICSSASNSNYYHYIIFKKNCFSNWWNKSIDFIDSEIEYDYYNDGKYGLLRTFNKSQIFLASDDDNPLITFNKVLSFEEFSERKWEKLLCLI